MPKFTKKSDFWGEPGLADVTKSPSNERLLAPPSGRSRTGKLPTEMQDVGRGYGFYDVPMPLHTDIGRSPMLSPEQMGERWRQRGWPTRGLGLPGGDVIEVEAPKIKGQGLDVENAELGFIPEGSNEAAFGTAQDLLTDGRLSPEDADRLVATWQAGAEGYTDALNRTRDKFNAVLDELNTDEWAMLSTNFLTNMPLVAGSLERKVDARISEVKDILANLDEAMGGNEGETGEAQMRAWDRIIATLRAVDISGLDQADDSSKADYLKLVSLAYGGSVEAMLENKLELEYPEAFKAFLIAYDETKESRGPKEGPTWEGILSRDFPRLEEGDMGPKARERQIIEKRDRFKSPGSIVGGGEVIPRIEAQKNPIVRDYADELQSLQTVRNSIGSLASKISNLPGKTLEASQKAGLAKAIMPDISELLKEMEKFYSSTFITKAGQIHGSFKVGNESKMAIYVMILNIFKAFNAWYQKSEGTPFTERHQLSEFSSVKIRMLKQASAFDKNGMHSAADIILSIME